MNTSWSGSEPTALHPTILIGYGRYGLRVMQSLLSSAVARGVLSWDESPEIATVNERRLRTLALFWIPDVLDREAEIAGNEAADSFEMMQDLYEQIERVTDESGNPGRLLAERVEAAKQRLFNEPLLTRERSQISVGLDVIVLAQPGEAPVLGKLRQILDPVLKKLGSDPGLTSPRDGQDLLNLLQILDFEHFWDPSAQQTAVRDTLVQSLEGASHSVDGRPAFGRIYLFDGRTERGNQDEAFRRQQAVLFLEFLIFDGHRTSVDLRTFYQRESRDLSAVCAIGARGIEHSTALLRRIAAASFARGWLGYLAGEGPARKKQVFSELLRPFSEEQIHATMGRAGVEQVIEEGLREIEKALAGIDPDQSGWAERVRSECERLTAEWTDRVEAAARAAGTALIRGRLQTLWADLAGAANTALTVDDSPVTIGTLLAEIKQARAALELVAAELPAPPPFEEFPRALLDEVHARYIETREAQVQPAMLRNRWWPLAAIAGAVALLPVAQEAADGVVAGAVPAWSEAAGLSVVMAALFWVAGTRLFHPRIAGRVHRALSFHTDAERGRIADAIRRLVASSGVEGRLRTAAEETLRGQTRRVIGEAIGQLERLRAPLAERAREMEWLNQQLHDYLNLQGVDAGSPKIRFLPNRRQNQVLRSIESETDLQAIAAQHPRTESEYRDLQRKFKIFEGWTQRYLNTFLDPHRFLDRLMATFPVPEWKDDGDFAERYASDITAALTSSGQFPASFYWLRSEGLPHQVAYCSLPDHWMRLRGLEPGLAGLGYRERRVTRAGGERMYLLQARLAVPPGLLRRSA